MKYQLIDRTSPNTQASFHFYNIQPEMKLFYAENEILAAVRWI